MRGRHGFRVAAAAGAAWALLAGPAAAQRIHREDFEGPKTKFELFAGPAAVRPTLLDHGFEEARAHGGKQAERIVVRHPGRDPCLFAMELPKAAVVEELSVSAWTWCNRPGVKLLVRVVLPNDTDPASRAATTLLLDGEAGSLVGRWKQLGAARLDLALAKQQGLLQARRQAAVDIRGAYADLLLASLDGAVGDIELLIDDVQAGPIAAADRQAAAPAPLPANLAAERMARPEMRSRADQRLARVDGGRLSRGGMPFFPRGVRRSAHPDLAAPIPALAEQGFNAVLAPAPIPADAVAAADRLRVGLVPMLGLVDGAEPRGGRLAPPDAANRDQWLAWHVGGNLDETAAPALAAAAVAVRGSDSDRDRPLWGDVVEGFGRMAEDLDIVNVRRFPLGTSLDLADYGVWLGQRRQLVPARAVLVNTIQAHPHAEAAKLAFGHGLEESFPSPVGPTPAQLRLLVAHTLAAGCRGLVYSSDVALSDWADGHDRMLQAALLNQQLALIEPFLAEGRSPAPCATDNANVRAVAFPHDRGVLLMMYWAGPNAQYVVGQAAAANVTAVVRGVPEAAQAHWLGLGGVSPAQRSSGLGGTRVTLPLMDVVEFVLLTPENGLVATFQERAHALAPRAAEQQRELAEIALRKTVAVVERLPLDRATAPEIAVQGRLAETSRQHLEAAQRLLQAGQAPESLRSSGDSLRVARQLQERVWKAAVARAPTPVSDPYLGSFYTLPEHYRFNAELAKAKFGENQLPGGDFERDGKLDDIGWTYVPFATDGLRPGAELVGDAQQGRRALELSANLPPAARGAAPPTFLEHTRVGLVSPAVPVRAGQVARISGYVKLPAGAPGSVDGAMLWDTLGGEGLALRFKKAAAWTRFVAYRPVRADGKLRLNLVMTGIGAARFDDLRVELSDSVAAPLAGKLESPAGADVRR